MKDVNIDKERRLVGGLALRSSKASKDMKGSSRERSLVQSDRKAMTDLLASLTRAFGWRLNGGELKMLLMKVTSWRKCRVGYLDASSHDLFTGRREVPPPELKS